MLYFGVEASEFAATESGSHYKSHKWTETLWNKQPAFQAGKPALWLSPYAGKEETGDDGRQPAKENEREIYSSQVPKRVLPLISRETGLGSI